MHERQAQLIQHWVVDPNRELSMGTLHGHIIDSATGEQISAKVHVLTSDGRFCQSTREAMLKRGPGTPFLLLRRRIRGSGLPVGAPTYLVERGTEYEPVRTVVEMPEHGSQRRRNHPQPLVYTPRKTTGIPATHTFTTTKKKPAPTSAWPLTAALKATTSLSSVFWTEDNSLMPATNILSAS